jgi:hypothetical protein
VKRVTLLEISYLMPREMQDIWIVSTALSRAGQGPRGGPSRGTGMYWSPFSAVQSKHGCSFRIVGSFTRMRPRGRRRRSLGRYMGGNLRSLTVTAARSAMLMMGIMLDLMGTGRVVRLLWVASSHGRNWSCQSIGV